MKSKIEKPVNGKSGNKKAYQFHPDLKKYENQNIPVIPCAVPVLQKLMGVLYSRERSDAEAAVSRLRIPVQDGVWLRGILYTPVGVQDNGPCLLFIHGGGFVYNAAPHHFALARNLAKKLGWKTILADYRLAPRCKYPTAPEDCFAVYQWLLEQAAALNINPAQIVVCGDSAGGNLATVLCLMSRDRGIPLPKAQMLLYPVTDRRMLTDSVKQYTDTPMCNSRDMEKYLTMYLGQEEPENIAYLSPIEAASLSGLPPAYVETAEYDCLHDEGIAYAKALQQAGVNVELHEVKAAMHGYDIAVDSSLVRELLEQRVAFLKRIVSS